MIPAGSHYGGLHQTSVERETLGSRLEGFLLQVVDMGDGKWKCDYDGMIYDTMVRRYIMQVCFADFTGEALLSVFNEQVMPASEQLSSGVKSYEGVCSLSWFIPL